MKPLYSSDCEQPQTQQHPLWLLGIVPTNNVSLTLTTFLSGVPTGENPGPPDVTEPGFYVAL